MNNMKSITKKIAGTIVLAALNLTTALAQTDAKVEYFGISDVRLTRRDRKSVV